MISSFDLNYDLSEETNATNYIKTTVSDGTTLKVHIPKLMANIPAGNLPTISNLSTDGASIFKNANNKPVVSSRIIKEQNFMVASNNTEMTSTDVNKITSEITKYLKSAIDSDVQNISTKKYTYTLNKGATIRTQFHNGKISKLSYIISNSSGVTKKFT